MRKYNEKKTILLMELFFISSPIGLLEVLIKENKLYSLSQVQKNNLKIKSKSKKSHQFSLSSKVFSGDSRFLGSSVFRKKTEQQTRILIKHKNISYLVDEKDLSILKQNLPSKYGKDPVDKKSLSILKQQKPSALAKKINQQLNSYFEGKLKKFKIPIYNRGANFQKKVWKALQKIPWGHTKQYSQIAQELENPKAYRAVGNSCAKNPFLIVVPCHRVLSQSSLGGFALGLKAKKYLLNLEQSAG